MKLRLMLFCKPWTVCTLRQLSLLLKRISRNIPEQSVKLSIRAMRSALVSAWMQVTISIRKLPKFCAVMNCCRLNSVSLPTSLNSYGARYLMKQWKQLPQQTNIWSGRFIRSLKSSKRITPLHKQSGKSFSRKASLLLASASKYSSAWTCILTL